MKFVKLSMGSGGKSTNEFIKNIIVSKLDNDYLNKLGDASYIRINGDIAFSTDSFVVQPEFFNGGDIGKLSVYGTCNDLAVSGAVPLFLSLSFVIPEGYLFDDLEKIINSIAEAACEVGVDIVCGDTKVVEKDALKGIIINTSGVGELKYRLNDYNNINIGDKIIFTSDIARHGVSVLIARNDLNVDSDIKSDCGNLFEIFKKIDCEKVHFARDATRGGVAAVLHEISEMSGKGFNLYENNININEDVSNFCDFFGYDPFSIANEGLAVLIVEQEASNDILKILRNIPISKEACIVGDVIDSQIVVLETKIGGKRRIEMPIGELLPRIC